MQSLQSAKLSCASLKGRWNPSFDFFKVLLMTNDITTANDITKIKNSELHAIL